MMYTQAGTSYVYFIYGMYYCFNIIIADIGIDEAVLIRALDKRYALFCYIVFMRESRSLYK